MNRLLLLLPLLGLVQACGGPPPRDADLPPVTLDLTGMLEGRLDPCGCTSNQLGGLAVRRTYRYMHRHLDTLPIEGVGWLPEPKYGVPFQRLIGRIVLRALGAHEGGMKQAALGVGARAASLGAPALARILTGTQAPPLVACDLEAPAGLLRPWVVAQGRRAKVWITALSRRPVRGAGFRHRSWHGALARALDRAPADGYRVLLLDGTREQAARVGRAFPGALDVILTAEGNYNPTPPADTSREAEPLILDPGGGGRKILEVRLTRQAGRTRNYFVTRPLTPWVAGKARQKTGAMKPDPALARIIREGRDRLYEEEALRGAAALARPVDRKGYVGSRACFPCHPESARVWRASRHAQAWHSLEEAEAQRGWPITLSPDCVSCHVVGLGDMTGFRSPALTPGLQEVGCEQCHGPGALHVRRMMVDPRHPDLAIDRADDGGQHCYRCHTSEQQTHKAFDFEETWARIKHVEKEAWADRVK